MGILTTTTGSFPKPRALKHARYMFREQQIDAAGLRLEEDKALAAVIALQERLGLSILTDGEMTRGDLVAHYAGCLEGVEKGLLVRCWGNLYVRRPRITGPIERTDSILAGAWKHAQQHTTLPLRAIVTGPYTLMRWSYDEHYPTRGACARAFASVIAEEVADLAKAGATEIQIDEPALGVDREETAWATSLIGEIGARRGSARLWAHVGFADPDPNWKALAGLPVDCLMIGLAHQRLESDAGLASIPAAMTLAAGVIDSIDTDVESLGQVRERTLQVARHVTEDRLILTTDTGLRGFAPAVAEEKVRRLVEAAR